MKSGLFSFIQNLDKTPAFRAEQFIYSVGKMEALFLCVEAPGAFLY